MNFETPAALGVLVLDSFLWDNDVDVSCLIETSLSPVKDIFFPGLITYGYDWAVDPGGTAAIPVRYTISAYVI